MPGFEAETGVRVVQDLYSDVEEMFAKLKTGVQGYDLVVATDFMVPRLKVLGLIDPFPQGRPAALSNIEPRFLDGAWDPGNRFTVPYLLGTTGIAYNKRKLGAVPNSWSELWDDRYAGKIGMLDYARDALGIAMLTLGLPPDSTKPELLEKAKAKLIEQKKVLKQYSNASYIDQLVAGELWLTAAWSGDVLQAARENKEVEFAIPKEGSFMWVDSFCLVAKSDNRDSALAFVDYTLRPEVAEEVVETVWYPTPNGKAKALLPAKLRGDERIFPPAEVLKRLRFHDVLSDEATQAMNKAWESVKLA